MSLARNRDPFGRITNGEIILNPSGEIVRDCLLEIPSYHKNITLGDWVIMPDHMHVVLVIEDLANFQAETALAYAHNGGLPHGTQPGSLNAVIQNFKSVSTRKVNQFCKISGERLWQRNFYEHIIRNEKELAEISLYVQENPRRWETGELSNT